MTTLPLLLCIVAPFGVSLILGLCRAAAETRTVDDGRGFGGDE